MNKTKLLLNNILLAEGLDKEKHSYLLNNFCGVVIDTMENLLNIAREEKGRQTVLYFTGNFEDPPVALLNFKILVVKEFSTVNHSLISAGCAELINMGEVPLNVHGVGVYFPHLFNEKNYFSCIESEHKFQALTESTKGGEALRKGIYLTKVEKDAKDGLEFYLLRCSSNLQGPTDNFRKTDIQVIDKTNEVISQFFENPARVNHVLAQIYYNVKNEETSSERKATIKAHSDKTKDMPSNGLIAFATFYDMTSIKDNSRLTGPLFETAYQKNFDIVFQGKSSILTQLEFVLKEPAAHPNLNPKFRVTLYPNSLFVISLETNRLYTHEIKPSPLPIDKIPVRLGYVMRSSMRKAVHRNGSTFIVENDGTERLLEPMNPKDMADIKDLYREENLTTATVCYRPIYTSLNQGDYQQPLI